ncbi:hypothetical protein Tco_1228076 [Tanacetum coccineum]
MIDQGVTTTLAARDANRNGDDNHTSGTGVRRTERVARECTYQDIMKCQPLYFKGTEGVVELTQWFEMMETVFRISHCSVENQINFSTCTLLAGALTWWNSHIRIVGHDVAYAMTWTELKKKLTDKYCPRNEMKKLEAKSTKFRKYDGVLPDMIHGSFCGVKTKTMHEATEMAQVDGQKDPTLSNAAGLSKGYKNVELFHVQQVQAAPIMDHVLVKCGKLARRIGHNDPRLSDWPELKNQDHGNQAEGTGARGLVHALGGGETDQDLNNIEDEIEA